MINDRRQLADVYQQTIDIVLEGHYTSENGEEVKLLDNTKMLKGSRFYTKPLDASNIPTLADGSTKIIVKNDDSIVLGAFGCGAFPKSSETYRKIVSRSHRREGVQGQVQAHRLRHP